MGERHAVAFRADAIAHRDFYAAELQDRVMVIVGVGIGGRALDRKAGRAGRAEEQAMAAALELGLNHDSCCMIIAGDMPLLAGDQIVISLAFRRRGDGRRIGAGVFFADGIAEMTLRRGLMAE